MLELYHGSVSTASERARFVPAEKGLPWTGHPVDLMAGANLSPVATFIAKIPIRESAAWWDLPPDIGARSLKKHPTTPPSAWNICRPSLGNCTIAANWFEYAPDYEAAFDDLLTRLRATPEWAFVEREVDIRLEGEMHNGTP